MNTTQDKTTGEGNNALRFKYRAVSGKEIASEIHYDGNKASFIRDLIMEYACGCTPVVEVEGLRVKPLRLSYDEATAFLNSKYGKI